MIGVSITINGKLIYHRTAINTTESEFDSQHKPNTYHVDTGDVIKHIPDDGAIVLAKKMLDTIDEKK